MSEREIQAIQEMRQLLDRVSWTIELDVFQRQCNALKEQAKSHFDHFGTLPFDIAERLNRLCLEQWGRALLNKPSQHENGNP